MAQVREEQVEVVTDVTVAFGPHGEHRMERMQADERCEDVFPALIECCLLTDDESMHFFGMHRLGMLLCDLICHRLQQRLEMNVQTAERAQEGNGQRGA